MQGFDATGAGPILAQSLEEFSRRGDRRNQMFNCGTGTDLRPAVCHSYKLVKNRETTSLLGDAEH
jgi:hypothetical protein